MHSAKVIAVAVVIMLVLAVLAWHGVLKFWVGPIGWGNIPFDPEKWMTAFVDKWYARSYGSTVSLV